MSITVKLTSPVEVAGETISEVTLREPTAAECRRFGDPYTGIVGATGETRAITHDNDVYFQYITKLAQLPPSTIDKMSARDFTAVRNAVFSFFF